MASTYASMRRCTSDVTATAGLDYTANSATLTFSPGVSIRMATVQLIADAIREVNETLRVDLSAPVSGSIGDGLGIGTILDDEETDFFTLTPCRLVNTQGGAPLTADSTRLFAAAGTCGIPASAKAIAVTLTVIDPTGPGYLILFPGLTDQPLSTSINFNTGGTRANNAVAALGGGGQLAVYAGMVSGSVHLNIDVFGYFE